MVYNHAYVGLGLRGISERGLGYTNHIYIYI